jgi:hypothetical protein
MKIKLPVIALTAMLLSFTPQQNTTGSFSDEISKDLKNSIKWKNTEINLGEIPQSKPVTIEFEFTNNGDSPVLITNVQASCGCTSTNYVKTPITPGETTKITAVFNAAAKGVFKKNVTVTTNADESPKTLTFMGTVI